MSALVFATVTAVIFAFAFPGPTGSGVPFIVSHCESGSLLFGGSSSVCDLSAGAFIGDALVLAIYFGLIGLWLGPAVTVVAGIGSLLVLFLYGYAVGQGAGTPVVPWCASLAGGGLIALISARARPAIRS